MQAVVKKCISGLDFFFLTTQAFECSKLNQVLKELQDDCAPRPYLHRVCICILRILAPFRPDDILFLCFFWYFFAFFTILFVSCLSGFVVRRQTTLLTLILLSQRLGTETCIWEHGSTTFTT